MPPLITVIVFQLNFIWLHLDPLSGSLKKYLTSNDYCQKRLSSKKDYRQINNYCQVALSGELLLLSARLARALVLVSLSLV